MRGKDDGGSVDEKVSGGAAPSGSFQEKKASYANGSLSLVQTRHLLLQFTNVAAHDVAQFLSSQTSIAGTRCFERSDDGSPMKVSPIKSIPRVTIRKLKSRAGPNFLIFVL